MPDAPIIIRGGSLNIKCKRSKLKNAVIEPDGRKYEHDLDGEITSVEIKSGTGKMKFELNAPIPDSKDCEIIIHYEVASLRGKKAK
ncbi:MAG: hypothetical protein WKF74_07910 [Pyrinomonadaceae bacterium]